MDDIKTIIISFIANIIAYLSPIEGVIHAVSMIFFINFFFGYIAGMLIDDEKFMFKKAFACIKEAAVFFITVAAIYSIGEHMKNAEGAIQAISAITYTLLYFYGANILKNMKKLFPECKWIAFLYWLISFEALKKMPLLQKFLAHYNNPNKNEL